MLHIFTSFLLLHFFVFLGWISKYCFKDHIHERSFVLISIYCLQPILIFWGILIRPIDWTLFLVPALYLAVMIMVTILVIPFRYTTHDDKDKAILQITGIVSNTGNLGIPFGLLIFGAVSVPYTAMINLINSIFITTIGAYRYSRGQFSIQKSLKNVIKLPMIYSAAAAIIWQLSGYPFPNILMQPLEMAAYTTMVLQLMIFGMFVATIKRHQLELKNILLVQFIKYAIFPITMITLLHFIPLPILATQCLILQSLMPIAVNNMNLAALYNCYPEKVAIHAIISTIIGLFIVPFII